METPDLPGCGTRFADRSPTDIAGTVTAVREAVKAPSPVGVLGLSLGGMVAYEWALRHPAEVGALVLINSSLGGWSPPWKRLKLGAAGHMLAVAMTRDPLARERRIHGFNSNQPGQVETRAAAWAELAQRQPVSRGNVVRQLLAAVRYRAQPGLTVPLLVLASQHDRMVDPSASRAITARLPGATSREHPGAGHDLPLDDPDWVLARIAEWLRRRS